MTFVLPPGADARFFDASRVTADVERRCDVCIVGSGAGGAVLAAGLAEAGLDVVMLEAGSAWPRESLTLQEQDAMPGMYQERGSRSTSDLSITIMQGRAVGGSTTVNWTTCYRTPPRILAHWATHHGLGDLQDGALTPHFEAVEARLNIGEWPESLANPNNRVLFDGCKALGWEVAPLRRNVKGCANSGYCGLGCPVHGKQSMGITYLTDALAAGMTLFSETVAERVETSGRKVTAVHARMQGRTAGHATGPRVVVRPKVFVAAGGAINTPALLLRSGLTGEGRIGRRTFLHPVIASVAVFDTLVRPFSGAPQTAASHHFVDRGPDKIGFFLEAAPLQPMLAAVAFNAFGRGLHDGMAELPHINGLLALCIDGLLPGDDGGTVSLRNDGRPLLDYPIRAPLAEAFQQATTALAKVQLAAGAARVQTMHQTPVELRTTDDLPRLAEQAYGAHEHGIFTAHQMGGCAMGTGDAAVVDLDHRLLGMHNAFVVDGSVLPTSLGVNPSQTIYGLAHRARTPVGEAV